MNTITRTTNPNGTYRYEIDGELVYAASGVLYTHASTYTVGNGSTAMFHKTEAAANKATGYRRSGWVKTGVQVIEDGDAPTPDIDAPTAPQFAPGDHGVIDGRGFTVSRAGANYAMVNWIDNAGRGIISDLTGAVRTMECTGFVLDVGRDWPTIKPVLDGTGVIITEVTVGAFTYRVVLHDGVYYGVEYSGNGGPIVDHGTNLHAAQAWLKAASARP